MVKRAAWYTIIRRFFLTNFVAVAYDYKFAADVTRMHLSQQAPTLGTRFHMRND